MPEAHSLGTPPDLEAASPTPAEGVPDQPGPSLAGLLDEMKGLGRLELIAVLRADQLRRWQQGQRVAAEAYFREVPALRDDPELAIDLIFSEFVLRHDVLKEAPSLDEYLARFPDYATPLRRQHLLKALWQEAAHTRGRADPAPQTVAAPPEIDDWTVLGGEDGAPAAAASAMPALPGYEVRGELGRGGMGRVLRGYDLHMGRDLAIKLLREEYQDHAHLVRRFLNEARVCGRLQHPGIVPVYALAELPDRRPYFTMKLVEGRTLAALLDERAGPAQGLPRLLSVFEQVCQALAYAHSKGVIHRDLKPDNVMVGAFGEVQVMDWGLAKVLHRDGEAPAEPAPGATHRPAEADQLIRTQSGGALGTLPYMPPEQARGEVERMDERCDVFGLGAILCEILTGAPPLTGRDGAELLARARAGDHAEALARLEASGADAELVRLAKGCLAAEPSARPRDAGVVAREMTAYLAGVQERLRAVELERWQAAVKAIEQRKRRRLAVGLAAAVLLLLLAGGGVVWRWQQRRYEADVEAGKAIDKALLLLEQAKADPQADLGKFREALAAARKAEEIAKAVAASTDVRHQATALVETAERERLAAESDRQLLEALLEVRGQRDEPTFQKSRGSLMALAEESIEEQFATAFRAWGLDVDVVSAEAAAARLRQRPTAVLTVVIAALDEWAAERRRLWRQKSEDAELRRRWQRLADLAAALDDAPDSRRRELRDNLARDNLARDRALGALAVALRPVPIPFDGGVGDDRQRLRRLAAETTLATEPVLGLVTLARALTVAGDRVLAERLLRSAVRVRPSEAMLHQTLGQLLAGQGRWWEAIECFAAARALRPELGGALAEALVNGGRLDEGLALWARLSAERPDTPWLLLGRGSALCGQGHLDEAEAVFREALRLDPDSPLAHNGLGNVFYLQGHFKEAEEEAHKAARIKRDFPQAHVVIGAALLARDDLKKAVAARSAEAAFREAVRFDPDYPQARFYLGAALAAQGDFVNAEEAFRKALQLAPNYVEAHFNLAATLAAQGRHPEAETECRLAIHLNPNEVKAHYNLGYALVNQSRFKDAEPVFREALRLKSDHAEALVGLGMALAGQARFAEMEAVCRQAVRFKPQLPDAHYHLGGALYRQGRYKDAEVEFREAVRLKPEWHEAHANLGFALREQGKFADARESFRESRRLPGSDPAIDARIKDCERLVELDLKLPAVLKGDVEPANAAERLELAALCQYPGRRLPTAEFRLAAEAFAAEPKLADDLVQQYRYNAACSAALVAAGQAEDAKNLPDKVVLMLRRKALRWLRADLALYAQLAEREGPAVKRDVRQRLGHWSTDADFVSVRDKEGLDKLPEAERQEWRRLWDDVAALLARVSAAP